MKLLQRKYDLGHISKNIRSKPQLIYKNLTYHKKWLQSLKSAKSTSVDPTGEPEQSAVIVQSRSAVATQMQLQQSGVVHSETAVQGLQPTLSANDMTTQVRSESNGELLSKFLN